MKVEQLNNEDYLIVDLDHHPENENKPGLPPMPDGRTNLYYLGHDRWTSPKLVPHEDQTILYEKKAGSKP